MTPRQRQAARELRARYRRMFEELEDFALMFDELRRALLDEPGVRLLATKTRHRRQGAGRVTERLDLIAYREPGGPRRPSYWVLWWWPCSWQDVSQITLAEARSYFETWGRLPSWHRAPVLLDESDRMERRERRARERRERGGT